MKLLTMVLAGRAIRRTMWRKAVASELSCVANRRAVVISSQLSAEMAAEMAAVES